MRIVVSICTCSASTHLAFALTGCRCCFKPLVSIRVKKILIDALFWERNVHIRNVMMKEV
jgi:hypothetical protein